jgi:uncharacterized protein YkwD
VRNLSVLSLLFVFAFGISGCANIQSLGAGQPRVTSADLERRIHRLINEERAQYQAAAVNSNRLLSQVARAHSRDMAERGFFDHEDPSGLTPNDRAEDAGYVCSKEVDGRVYEGISENIAMQPVFRGYRENVVNGQATRTYDWMSPAEIAAAVVDGWMDSPGHRDNIIDVISTEQGIGVYIHNDEVYVTQVLC